MSGEWGDPRFDDIGEPAKKKTSQKRHLFKPVGSPNDFVGRSKKCSGPCGGEKDLSKFPMTRTAKRDRGAVCYACRQSLWKSKTLLLSGDGWRCDDCGGVTSKIRQNCNTCGLPRPD